MGFFDDMNEIVNKTIGAATGVYAAADEFIEKKTGKGLIDRQVEFMEAEEKERDQQPLKWAGKKFLKGVAKGVFGIGWDSTHN